MHATIKCANAHREKGGVKGQFTLDYVLSTAILVTLISATVMFISGYKENLTGRYDTATINSIASDVSYTITSVYVAGRESDILPGRNEPTMVASGGIILPGDIGGKFFGIEIRSSERLVCGIVGNVTGCANIVGVPSDFDITGVAGGSARNLRVVYWREPDGSGGARDYILVG